jgi:hypothetical protein
MGRDALPTIEQDGSVDEGGEQRGSDIGVGFWGRPPRLWFHLALSAAVLVALWSVSSPGFALVSLLGAIGALWLLALVWLARAIAFGTSRHRRPRSARWLALAPLTGLVVVALMAGDVPLRTRWALSRPAFEQALDDVADPGDGDPYHVAASFTRLGSYRIESTTRDGNAVLFYEPSRPLIDYSGFAYLPDGPTPAVEARFETSRFEPLGGSWYSFTATW